ncbi:MAG: hypothetical protein WCB11_25330, partial [Terriglobales bacterium]
MLRRLGIGGQTGRERFTKFSLSLALHTRPDEIVHGCRPWTSRPVERGRDVSSKGNHNRQHEKERSLDESQEVES